MLEYRRESLMKKTNKCKLQRLSTKQVICQSKDKFTYEMCEPFCDSLDTKLASSILRSKILLG